MIREESELPPFPPSPSASAERILHLLPHQPRQEESEKSSCFNRSVKEWLKTCHAFCFEVDLESGAAVCELQNTVSRVSSTMGATLRDVSVDLASTVSAMSQLNSVLEQQLLRQICCSNINQLYTADRKLADSLVLETECWSLLPSRTRLLSTFPALA